MVRPLHRWKSFWFGLLVLAFLGWAWVWSIGYRVEVSWHRAPKGIIAAGLEDGQLSFRWLPDHPTVPPEFAIERMALPQGETWFPPATWMIAGELDGLGEVGQVTLIRIPHWFLLLGFLVPWAGFLVWRVRRVRRVKRQQLSEPKSTPS